MKDEKKKSKGEGENQNLKGREKEHMILYRQ
jgi:hypothetical protein